VEAVEPDSVILADGNCIPPAVIIAATGFSMDLDGLVGHLGVLDERGKPRGGFASHLGDGMFAIGHGIPPNGPLRAIRLAGKDHLQRFAQRKILDHVVPSGRTASHRVRRLVLHPDVARGDADANASGQQQQNRVDASADDTRVVNRAGKKEQRHDDEHDALENAQRTRLDAELQLYEYRVSVQRGANQKSAHVLRAKCPAKWIQHAILGVSRSDL
jgi:hypothetical protein